jgi:PDZ domain-containing protein
MTDASPAEPRVPRRLAATIVVVIVIALIVLVYEGAIRVSTGEFVLSPGQAQAVGPLIKVPKGPGHHTKGHILLTDVFVSQVSALELLFDRLNSDDQVLPADELVDPGIPTSELSNQGFLEMAQSQTAAKVAALRRLGYTVPEHNAGAVVDGVVAGSPAASVLRVGQVITAVDGATTPTACAVTAALHGVPKGGSVTLAIQRDRLTMDGRQKQGPTVQRTMHLAALPPGDDGESPCTPGRAHGFLGVETATQQDFSFPVAVSINTKDIGGPSAGLAMTLGVLDALSGGQLVGDKTIAATGTIAPNGAVGDVGGVPQKTIAVERAGATVFLVPPQELAAARSKATPSLHVYAVSTLAQALSVLERLGGRLPQRIHGAPA